jgi:hypothetical protein
VEVIILRKYKEPQFSSNKKNKKIVPFLSLKTVGRTVTISLKKRILNCHHSHLQMICRSVSQKRVGKCHHFYFKKSIKNYSTILISEKMRNAAILVSKKSMKNCHHSHIMKKYRELAPFSSSDKVWRIVNHKNNGKMSPFSVYEKV